MPDDAESRCPACNPIHVGGFMRGRPQTYTGKPRGGAMPHLMASKRTICELCKGTRRVPVEVSRRFVDAISPSTFREM